MGSESYDSYDSHTRKRVGKACDRCRLKKSKCDGAHPCTRCRLDNTICYYGERKKSVDKVYPKGYVEILELQQAQLVAGLRKAFTILTQCDNFPGGPLPEQEDGFPLTHDILDKLDVLHQPEHNPEGADHTFDDDLDKIQERLNQHQKPRRSSPSYSDSDDSTHLDSPQLPDSPTDSWVSSRSPRKRSLPLTPQPPQLELSLPQKRHKRPGFDFNSTLAMGQVPHFQDPIIMGSPQSFNSPDAQFPGSFGDENMGMVTFTESFEPMQTSWPTVGPTVGVYNTMDIFSMTTGPDPDFETFMRSGFHPQ